MVLKTFPFPVPPPSLDDLYERFERAVTPRTKVILLCQITNLTGQIFPTREICRMARARGIKTIAWFNSATPLKSGWAWGQHYLENGIAAFEAEVGKGHLYVF